MRITPEILFKIARDTVTRRARSDRDLLSAYLHGSVLDEEPLLGGTTDIDLVFIHHDEVVTRREIQRLTDDVHLDIAHHARSDYRRARALRMHPWLGPNLFGCKVLYDPQHFLDFTQASVCSQFNRPDYVYGRAEGLVEHARQMWLGLHDLPGEPGPDEANVYLRAVEHVANGVASLSGPPLTERRFLLNFPARAEALGKPGLYPGLMGLLGAPGVTAETLSEWLPQWEAAYNAIPAADVPARLHPHRQAYYRRAFEEILLSSRPLDVLWPLLKTWVQSAQLLPGGSPEHLAWQESFAQLGLLGDGFSQRVAALDAYLDTVEETLEAWARANGA